jgi:hypothetical protein
MTAAVDILAASRPRRPSKGGWRAKGEWASRLALLKRTVEFVGGDGLTARALSGERGGSIGVEIPGRLLFAGFGFG